MHTTLICMVEDRARPQRVLLPVESVKICVLACVLNSTAPKLLGDMPVRRYLGDQAPHP